MIAQETIAEVKERANLVEIVGEHVALKRQGSGYSGLCPFHAEKTPSFHVRDSGEYYHCFGCGNSGNIFSFVMAIRGLSFPEAVEELAERYGVEIKRDRGPARVDDSGKREELFKLTRLAQEYFRRSLSTAIPPVKEYLKTRGLDNKICDTFGVGFAPQSWDSLTKLLTSKKFDPNLMLQTGLVRRNSKGELIDGFRGRLMFPIWLDDKRIAGFGGRVIPTLFEPDLLKSAPKYLNSPESPVYQKSKILYGLPQALKAMREERAVYLVEGYMDVVGLWAAGVENVIAACGTAVTEDHVKRLGSLVNRVKLVFDGDVAGRQAAAKCFATFLNSGVDVTALFLPENEDPDTISRSHGAKTGPYLESLPDVALVDCYIDFLLRRYGAESALELGAASKGRLATELSAALSKVRNEIERSELVERAALRLKVEPTQLGKMTDTTSAKTRDAEPKPLEKAEVISRLKKNIADLLPEDRGVLQVVMALKGKYPERVLMDPVLSQGLDWCTLSFIDELRSIVGPEERSDESKKEGIKNLLKEYGDSWLEHWRKSYEISEEPDFNPERVLTDCQRNIKERESNQLVTKLKEQLAEAPTDAEKARLSQEIIALRRGSVGRKEPTPPEL